MQRPPTRTRKFSPRRRTLHYEPRLQSPGNSYPVDDVKYSFEIED
ncbi:hypothetical protein [Chamaesiphon sp. OTE_8_metabat_110]|nr:hypothetical protein [Chamaesiphon sp. OTE_8_metabat_110]